jgi:hypothetical protein
MRLGNIITDVALAGVQKVGQFFSDSIQRLLIFKMCSRKTQAIITSDRCSSRQERTRFC